MARASLDTRVRVDEPARKARIRGTKVTRWVDPFCFLFSSTFCFILSLYLSIILFLFLLTSTSRTMRHLEWVVRVEEVSRGRDIARGDGFVEVVGQGSRTWLEERYHRGARVEQRSSLTRGSSHWGVCSPNSKGLIEVLNLSQGGPGNWCSSGVDHFEEQRGKEARSTLILFVFVFVSQNFFFFICLFISEKQSCSYFLFFFFWPTNTPFFLYFLFYLILFYQVDYCPYSISLKNIQTM